MSDECLLRLKEILRSFAARVPKIILQRVEEVYPALKESLQNIDTIKVENDFLIKENSIDVETDKVYRATVCSIKEADLKHCVDALRIGNSADIKGEEIASAMCSDDVYTPSAYSRNEVEPQICTILMKDVPGPSSETCNWAMSVKVEEEDPLAIPFPSVKTEPGSNVNEQLIHGTESLAHQTTVKNHQRTQCGACPYSCNVCNKSFNNKKTLKVHRHIHSEMWPFSCGVCKMLFRQEDDLKVHQCIPTSAQPFSCEPCNKSFRFLSDLKRHERTHTGERPFPCDVCNKSFTHSDVLKTHHRVHTGERPFVCDVCMKSFSTQSMRKNHQRVHSEERPYACGLCNKSFKSGGSKKKHQEVHKWEHHVGYDVLEGSDILKK